MERKAGKFVYWTPRVLSILFILFLALLSLDILDMKLGFWGTIVGLTMHNIPVFVLTIILIISWKHEIVGGIAFILVGISYIVMVLINIATTGFQWYYLAWALQISGIAFFIGIMFLVGWFKRKKSA